MPQPPPSGRGPAGEPARGPGVPGGTGSPGAAREERAHAPGAINGAAAHCGESARGPRASRGRAAPGGGPPPVGGDGRDPRLAGFAEGGPGDAGRAGAALAAVVEELSGPEWRCPGADDDELMGLLGRWEAIGSWAEAGKLGVVRELIRRRARPGLRGRLAMHGDLPDAWQEGMAHEVSLALGISIRAADNLILLAWDLQARLPQAGAALAVGLLSPLKARIVSEELKVLPDEQAGQAEKLILDQLTPVTTPGQLGRLAAQAVVTVDPEGAARRREYAEREQARVRFWRENGGACALAAYGLPTDAALAANAAINDRAAAYKAAKVRPDARMDQLRVLAFLDILNGITCDARLAQARSGAGDGDGTTGGNNATTSVSAGDASTIDSADDVSTSDPGRDARTGDGGGTESSGEDAACVSDKGSGKPGGRDDSSVGGSPGPGRNGRPPPDPVLPALTARANLTLPLATLLGMADRPGAGHGLGPLDPALVRDLAVTAVASPYSQWCLTITDADGVAVAHGCARPARTKNTNPPPASRAGPPGRTPWALTRRHEPGPSGGYGTWTLTLPGGRDYTVSLGPVPVSDCDHRHESNGYQPNDTLRHLVQIRDGTCTFPTCSRHARESDFEHAAPFDRGGRTCACNGGARSRRCHRVKQSPGWAVTQPEPGRHQWTTPSGRTYTQGPMRYPA